MITKKNNTTTASASIPILPRGNDTILTVRFYNRVTKDGKTTESALDMTSFKSLNVIAENDGTGVRTKIEWGHTSGENNALSTFIPHTLPTGDYSLEVIAVNKSDYHTRYFDISFKIKERTSEANTTQDVITAYSNAFVRATVQVTLVSVINGKSAYDLWRETPGNEDKGIDDFVKELSLANSVEVMDADDAAEMFNAIFGTGS